ncbi:MAG: DUF1573 domain-containing protein [Phycisphaerales bacterium]|nr:DUF1573 domain-containing protein [Phycisphaerales bacterium]
MRRDVLKRATSSTLLVCVSALLFSCGGDAAEPSVAPPVTKSVATETPLGAKALPQGAERISFDDAANATRVMRGASASAGPITASPASVDFGVVRPHSVVEGTIRLTNTSSQPIILEKATPSCTCTTVDMEGKSIPANGSLDMPMSMKTNDAIGAKVAKVTMVFRGVPQPLIVTYNAETAFIVRASPPYIDTTTADLSGKIELDASKLRGEFKLQADDRKTFRVLSVDNAAPSFVGFDPKTDAPRFEYTLSYNFASIPETSIPRWIIVETDREDCPLVDLRVRHPATRYVPTIPFEQFRASAGATAPNQPAEFSILLKKFVGRILAVKSGDPRFKVTSTRQTSDESGILIHVELGINPSVRGTYLFPVHFTVQAVDSGTGATSQPVQADLFVYGLVR